MPNHPYISGQGPLVATVAQLRKGFPAKVDAGYLRRFKIAPGNESYVISILRFLGLIDEDGNRVEANTDYFYGNDESFKSGFERALRSAYAQLFDEMGEDALNAQRDGLAHWFRAADKTSDLVGKRQAATFQTLAALAGHGEPPAVRSNASKKPDGALAAASTKATAKKAAAPKKDVVLPSGDGSHTADAGGPGGNGEAQARQDVGLTVRIEVNLPPDGDANTYDAIFASIRKHLMS